MRIVAIKINTNPARWVEGTFPRGSMLGITTTDNLGAAKDFKTRMQAMSLIERIHNPLNREFSIEEYDIDPSRRDFDDDDESIMK